MNNLTNPTKTAEIVSEIIFNNPKAYVTICYDNIHIFSTKASAISFYRRAAMATDGCERERYVNIVFKLQDGFQFASDNPSICTSLDEMKALSSLNAYFIELTGKFKPCECAKYWNGETTINVKNIA